MSERARADDKGAGAAGESVRGPLDALAVRGVRGRGRAALRWVVTTSTGPSDRHLVDCRAEETSFRQWRAIALRQPARQIAALPSLPGSGGRAIVRRLARSLLPWPR